MAVTLAVKLWLQQGSRRTLLSDRVHRQWIVVRSDFKSSWLRGCGLFDYADGVDSTPFQILDGRPAITSPDTLKKGVRRLAKKAGFTRVSFRSLRHSYGSQLLAAGVPQACFQAARAFHCAYNGQRLRAPLASDESTAAEKWEAAMQRAAGSKVVETPLKKKQAC